MLFSALPDAQGLYDPDNESDSCGVAMVTDIQGRRSHSIVADGLTALEHLEHRAVARIDQAVDHLVDGDQIAGAEAQIAGR